MIKEGATTCYEVWGKNQKWNTSLFHPWSTAPVAVLFEEKENILKNIISPTREQKYGIINKTTIREV